MDTMTQATKNQEVREACINQLSNKIKESKEDLLKIQLELEVKEAQLFLYDVLSTTKEHICGYVKCHGMMIGEGLGYTSDFGSLMRSDDITRRVNRMISHYKEMSSDEKQLPSWTRKARKSAKLLQANKDLINY